MTLGTTTVVYNGESYNFRELRTELQTLGHTFRGHSDTEVLLHAYQAWGLPGLERLEGIFAFALWDAARSRLVLMRDRLGVKPLFYARQGTRLAFGSEIKAVFAGVEADRSPDEQAFSEYLWYGNAFEDRTLYRGVRALEPGWRLIAEDGQTRLERWWRIESWLANPPPERTPDETADALRGRDRCRSDTAAGERCTGGHLSQRRTGFIEHCCVCGTRRGPPSQQFLRRLRL